LIRKEGPLVRQSPPDQVFVKRGAVPMSAQMGVAEARVEAVATALDAGSY
jgi:hypothetical protein